MIVILLALAIVAFLAKDAFIKYGLLSPAQTSVKGTGPTGAADRPDAPGTPTTPANVMDRARDAGAVLKQQESKRGGD